MLVEGGDVVRYDGRGNDDNEGGGCMRGLGGVVGNGRRYGFLGEREGGWVGRCVLDGLRGNLEDREF